MYVTKTLGQKTFWVKKKYGPKTFGQKKVVQKIKVQRNLGPK